MWHSRTSYKSLAEYDLERLLEQKRNMAQVESVLTLYERNNLHLVDHVQALIHENEILRQQQALCISPSKSKFTPINLKKPIPEARSYL